MYTSSLHRSSTRLIKERLFSTSRKTLLVLALLVAALSLQLQIAKNLPSSSLQQESNAAEATVGSAAHQAFSKLQLFVSAFPGEEDFQRQQLNDDDRLRGFIELRETFLRSLQFFWPQNPHWKLTVVLDEPANPEHRELLTEQVYSLFDDSEDARDWVSVLFNTLTDQSLYGTGWYIQQLIMLWADNFTDAEYIGFVDDDTIITKAVEPIDIFDESGRPRALVKPAREGVNKAWTESADIAFGRPSSVYAMTYFPVVVKRDHFHRVRQEILKVHQSEYSYFDEFFTALIHRKNIKKPHEELTGISQFCILMDYVFERHRDEYSWHFETTTPEIMQMIDPVPRIAIHASYMFMNLPELRKSKTFGGRRSVVSDILREGYCFSLPLASMTRTDQNRCKDFDIDSRVYLRGEWKFEDHGSAWIRRNSTSVWLAHKKRAKYNRIRKWNGGTLKALFG